MKEKLKEILPKFVMWIKGFVKINRLLIVILILSIVFLFFISTIKAYSQELYFLKTALYFIVFIAFICLFLPFPQKDKGIILGYLIGFFAILIMILEPAIQNAEIKENRIIAIREVNKLNCAMATANITALEDLTKEMLLNYFVVDIYYENFPYGYLTEWAVVSDMESSNKLIDIVHQLSIQAVANSGSSVVKKISENIERQNNHIIDLSQDIQKLLSCP